MNSSAKNEYTIIIYWLSCCYKPVWCSFISGTQKCKVLKNVKWHYHCFFGAKTRSNNKKIIIRPLKYLAFKCWTPSLSLSRGCSVKYQEGKMCLVWIQMNKRKIMEIVKVSVTEYIDLISVWYHKHAWTRLISRRWCIYWFCMAQKRIIMTGTTGKFWHT